MNKRGFDWLSVVIVVLIVLLAVYLIKSLFFS